MVLSAAAIASHAERSEFLPGSVPLSTRSQQCLWSKNCPRQPSLAPHMAGPTSRTSDPRRPSLLVHESAAQREKALFASKTEVRNRPKSYRHASRTSRRKITKKPRYPSHLGRRTRVSLAPSSRSDRPNIAADRKITPNVRRILTYQRTFAHYLADEEAQLALGGGTSTVAGPATVNKAGSTRTQATPIRTQQLPMHPPPKPPTSRTTAGIKQESAPALPSPQPAAPTLSPDNDPLLRSHTPKPPSARVMAALLAEPPLSYNAARATSSPDSGSVQPPRHFCAICGYWGKVKCLRCGERTCGLMECWKGHEAGCGPY